MFITITLDQRDTDCPSVHRTVGWRVVVDRAMLLRYNACLYRHSRRCTVRASPAAEKRKIGVHVSLDLDTLGRVDAIARRRSQTRSELLRQMIMELTEDEEAADWLAREGAQALEEESIPWEQARAELGL
jgi:predicted transcriptional regulator